MTVAERPRVVATASFWWRVVIVALILVALLSYSHRLEFFTSQVSVLTLFSYAVATFLTLRRASVDFPAPRLRGAIVLYQVMTLLISHFVNNHGRNPIPGIMPLRPPWICSRTVRSSHYVVPVLVLLEFLLFRPHGVLRWRDIPVWLIFPLAWVATSMLRAGLPGVPNPYPYPFLDPTERGYGFVFAWVGGLAVGVIALAFAIVALDRLRGRAPRR